MSNIAALRRNVLASLHSWPVRQLGEQLLPSVLTVQELV